MKTYFGSTQTTENYLGNIPIGDNGITKGDDPTPPVSPVDPESIGGLLLYVDADKSTVYTSGSFVSGVENLGSLGGQFNPYPSNALPLKFYQSAGGKPYFRFDGTTPTPNYMLSMWFNIVGPPYILGKTIISIANMAVINPIDPIDEQNAKIWSLQTTPNNAVMSHPASVSSPAAMNGYAKDSTVNPDTYLPPYVGGETPYTMFAWSSPNYKQLTDSKFQTKVGNSTSATYSNPTTPGSYPMQYYFVNSFYEGDTTPPATSKGINYHVAHMVYDSVLTEAQINGIYNYYNVTRGYLMN